MTDYRKKLQELLYELFQFDSADLDFGFYAVMNQKRGQISQFIETDLLAAVSAGLQAVAEQSRVEARRAFEKVRQNLLTALGPSALIGDELASPLFAQMPIGQEYQAAKDLLTASIIAEEMEVHIYNDLYAFFARYYQDGDFISQRRYGHSDKYAVPYNGQEVHLHWANFDQYYVKSGLHFNNYSFNLPGGAGLAQGANIQVRLTKIDLPRDNTKGDKRFFIYPSDRPATWDEADQTLLIPMEYRPLTPPESEHLSGRNQQEQLLEEAHAAIIKAIPNPTLRGRLLEPDPQKKSDKDRLAYHLNRYAAENSRDFFVHKDLGGFLTREFDYYLKAEVLHLEDINFDDPIHARRAAARLKTTRATGQKVIDFLDQLESFQRHLFLKRKFILQSDYCLTLDKLPAAHRSSFYPEILANERQLAEWRSLYSLTVTPATNLDLHPHLMLDTAFFSPDFKSRLLACFDDLDAATDGLLVHSENSQALNLLLPRYGEQVKCIYIDPPYNTGSDDNFAYKDTYQHSTWLTMMQERLALAYKLLSPDGVTFVSIDDREKSKLKELMDIIYNPGVFIASFVRRRRASSAMSQDRVSQDHEYVLAYGGLDFTTFIGVDKDYLNYSNPDDDPRGDWVTGDLTVGMTREQRPNQYYDLVNPKTNKVYSPDPNRVWAYYPETMQQKIEENLVIFPEDTSQRPKLKRFKKDLRSSTNPISTWIDTRINGEQPEVTTLAAGLNTEGTRQIQSFFEKNVFSYAKPTSLVSTLVKQVTDTDEVVVDFFAGSGTSAHAVMSLNKTDNSNRKYILIEIGEYFDTVLKPRIQKVAYADEWKDGQPVLPENGQIGLFNTSGQAHMFHYLRLESYDDTFHNLRFQELSGPQLDFLHQLPDYFLRYMLDHETAGSPTRLDIGQFERPFDYHLHVTGADGVLSPQPVDLVATFNFLLGLSVQTLRHYNYQGSPVVRVTGQAPDGKQVCVLWRNALAHDQLDAERDWLLAHVLADAAYDRLYVNGENTLPNALLIETEFKQRMFESAAANP